MVPLTELPRMALEICKSPARGNVMGLSGVDMNPGRKIILLNFDGWVIK